MLQAAAIFSSHMVLQRKKNITIWGKTDSKEKIIVAMHNQVVEAMIYKDTFEATLQPMEAGGPYDIIIRQGEEVVRYLDVMIGEVWYAGGQSNMELALINSLDGKRVVSELENNNIRFYQVLRKSFFDEESFNKERDTGWEVCEKGACGEWSAVGTYFAMYLQEKLGVPVGVIGCNLGATSGSCWTTKERLGEDLETSIYIDEYNKAMEGKSLEQYESELREYNEWYGPWQEKVDELYANDPKIEWSKVLEIAGECRWPEPLGPKSPFRPGGLHETMVMRIAGYALRGAIYYQGEQDEDKAEHYDHLLEKVIEQLREDWNEEDLPVMIVQLPRNIFSEQPDKGEWAVLREKQMAIHKKIANTGLAVTIDCGEFNNIHPLEKKEVGKRLALQALYHVYNQSVKAYGPMFRSAAVADGVVTIRFTNVEGKLVYKEDEFYQETRKEYHPSEEVKTVISENGFEAAGLDGVFYPAEILLDDTRIHLKCKEVKEIVTIRYAYHNFSPVTIFDQSRLPLAPFCKNIRGFKLK